MSGTPTESEIQTIWQNAVDLLETQRALSDDTITGGGNLLDVLLQSLEGEYTPTGIANAAEFWRATLSILSDQSTALNMLTPILFEYGQILAADASLGFGSGYTNVDELFEALYEWFVDKSYTVQSRNITYDTTATAGASNVGNGAMSRCTTDDQGFDLEFCFIEKKQFRCRRDQNSGADENAEEFEFVGTQASKDALQRHDYGSGEATRTTLVSKHAGSGNGGSILTNSSFSEYSATGSPKFTGWTEDSGGSNISQDTTTFYRSFPGAQTDASLKFAGNAKISQPITAMRERSLSEDVPYFLRVMYNFSAGSGDGTLTIRMGSVTANVTYVAQAGWNELLITPGQDSWFRTFNEDPFDVEIELSGWSTGTVLIDDVLFAPFDEVDGTFWFLRGNATTHTPWLLDDILTFTDTGGAPATAKIQWWLNVAGLGYLPSTTGTPTFADP